MLRLRIGQHTVQGALAWGILAYAANYRVVPETRPVFSRKLFSRRNKILKLVNDAVRRITSLVPHTMYAVKDADGWEYIMFGTPGSASTDSNAVTLIDSSDICYCSLDYARRTFYLLGEAAMCNVNMEIKYA